MILGTYHIVAGVGLVGSPVKLASLTAAYGRDPFGGLIEIIQEYSPD